MTAAGEAEQTGSNPFADDISNTALSTIRDAMINTFAAQIDKWANENDGIWNTACRDKLERAYNDIEDGKDQIKDIHGRLENVVGMELTKIREDVARIGSENRLSLESCRELVRSEILDENGAINRLVGKMVQLELQNRSNGLADEITQVRNEVISLGKRFSQEQKSIRQKLGPRAGKPPTNAQFDQLNQRLRKMEQELQKAQEFRRENSQLIQVNTQFAEQLKRLAEDKKRLEEENDKMKQDFHPSRC